MYSKKAFSVFSITAFSLSSATALADQPKMTFFEIGYNETKVDDFFDNDDFSGVTISGSYELPNSFYLTGSFSHASSDEQNVFRQDNGSIVSIFSSDIDRTIEKLRLGFGYIFDVSDTAIVTADINYLDLSTDTEGYVYTTNFDDNVSIGNQFSRLDYSESGNGYSVRVMYQKKLTDKVQIGAGVTYETVSFGRLGSGDIVPNAEGIYQINDNLAFKLSGAFGDDKTYMGSIRYSF